MSLARRLLAEAVGTTALLATVVGSGIMGTQLAAGNDAIALLANAAATAGLLYVAIVVLGPLSGAHFNPAVTLAMRLRGELDTRATLAYVGVQCVAATAGVVLAHAMFDLPLLQVSAKLRTGTGQWIAEAVATAGLLLVILRAPQARVAAMVAAYIGAAYWFTASTSFANPAVAVARAFSTPSRASVRRTCQPSSWQSPWARLWRSASCAGF